MTDNQYKCPYCGISEYNKNSKIKGCFKSWTAVSRHVPKCRLNTGDCYITESFGVIYLSSFKDLSLDEIFIEYPKISNSNLSAILKKLKQLKLVDRSFTFRHSYNKQEIIEYIKEFVEQTGRVPGIRDFGSQNPHYPSHDTVKNHFGSWNEAIRAADFEVISDGFGTNTTGLDGHKYRSKAEAYFADTYLFGKYTYDIEPEYPKPYRRYYDWYIHILDLYIELDGGIRPDIISLKIKINKTLNKHCIVIPTSKIYNTEYINAALAQR